MAKKIKAVKCPQCGSVEQTQLKADYYRCNSCGTEYFLDSDDVNINHNHRYHYHTPQAEARDSWKSLRIGLIIAGVVFAVIVLMNVIFAIVSGGSRSSSNNTASIPRSESSKPVEQFYWSGTSTTFFEDDAGKPLLLLVGEERSRGSTDEGQPTVAFYDVMSDKQLTKHELPLQPGSVDADFKRFENGELYFIINDSKLFRVDKQDQSVQQVTAEAYNDVLELQAGFAKIEFAYSSDGDGFRIMTNEGKQVFFYPLIKKAYSKDEFYQAKHGFEDIPANSPTRTGFTFSSNSTFYPEEKIQLVKYRYKSATGYPKSSPRFGWDRDYGGSGIFTGSDPYKKVFITERAKNDARVVSYTDLTPDRLYFKPGLLDYNEQYVLIAFKPTPAEDATYSVQLLDANTGEIQWTYATDDNYISGGWIASSGCFVEDLFIGPDGKLKHEFKQTD